MIQIVIIDNHDSFTWNLYQLFYENKDCTVEVIQNDQVNLKELRRYDKIVFSPGPDTPRRFPQMFDILEEYSQKKSILGICLGHQAIVEYFGGQLVNLEKPRHGIQENIEIIHPEEGLFLNLGNTMKAGLYHSWAVKNDSLPPELQVTAIDKDRVIMGVAHTSLNIKGIQFHPESYMTPEGARLIDNWLKI